MEKSKFVDPQQQREKIREFCQRATDAGGVLLVSGGRGLGKTRLVDEALSERRIEGKPNFWHQLFGDVSDSKRFSVRRAPNQVKRHLIKIEVDPYFPYATDQAAKKNAPKAAKEPDENALAVALIRNIVVGLTSVLDCRYRQRAYGKALTAKLGFWRYWFSNNALLWRANHCIQQYLSLYMLILSLLMPVLACTSPYFFTDTSLGLSLSVLSPLTAWLFLRWRDWRALHHMSEKLYALVHADESGENRHYIEESKHNKLLIPALLACLIIILIPDEIKTVLPIVSQLSFPTDTIQGLLAIFLSVGVVWASSRKIQKHAEFNQNNPVWMLTLLKRYLFLCHRCGLEPVLVFDELDKLEDIPVWRQEMLDPKDMSTETKWQETSINSKKADATKKPQRLNAFLLTIARLKSSLGAEFLWVLIGGTNIYSRLQKDRQGRYDGSLGLLATTIHQEIIVGAMSLKAVVNLDLKLDLTLQKNEQHKKIQEKYLEILRLENNDVHQAVKQEYQAVKEKYLKTLWLKSYGNYATLLRNHEKQNYSHHTITEQLATKVSEIWNPQLQLQYINLSMDNIWLEKIHADWVQNWIHSGMMEFANDLLKQRLERDQARNMLPSSLPTKLSEFSKRTDTPVEIVALQSENGQVLMTLGKTILYAYLNAKNCISDENNSGEITPYLHLNFSKTS